MMTSHIKNKTDLLFALKVMFGLLVIVLIISVLKTSKNPDLVKPNDSQFLAPGRDWKSQSKVEDYFVTHEHMSSAEALKVRDYAGSDGKVSFRLLKDATLQTLSSDLEEYGFVRSKEALMYALDNSPDNLPGHQEALKIGKNTVDIWASYRISENMTAWEIADQLLNHPNYFAYDENGYLFMP